MSRISDDDLILFHYRDGQSSERRTLIETALASSPSLAERYRTLQRLLAAADADIPPPPDAAFDERIWRRLRPRLVTSDAASGESLRPIARTKRRRWAAAGLAAAAALLAALYLPVGRIEPPSAPSPEPRIAARAPDADGVLTAYVATHLRNTEGLLLSVINSDSPTLMPAQATLRSLADDNRLYAAAAAKRGDKALAGFLDTLDPVLTELANQPRTAEVQAQGLRDLVRERDLLFQLRAVEARLRSRGGSRPQARGAMT